MHDTPPTSTPFESFASPLVHLEASPIHLVHPYRCSTLLHFFDAHTFAPEVHCDCDACTEGAKKKCNGVEKLPYAPTVQVLGNDMVWRYKKAHTSTPFESFASPAVHMAHFLSPKKGFALKMHSRCIRCLSKGLYIKDVKKTNGVHLRLYIKDVKKKIMHQRCKDKW